MAISKMSCDVIKEIVVEDSEKICVQNRESMEEKYSTCEKYEIEQFNDEQYKR